MPECKDVKETDGVVAGKLKIVLMVVAIVVQIGALDAKIEE
jgi:hypothetical protein